MNNYLALAGLISAATILIYWQRRQNTLLGAEILGHSALALELLGLMLSLYWATSATTGGALSVVFVVGWIAMMIGRAVLIPQLQQQHATRFKAVIVAGICIAYAALYGSGFFHAINDTSADSEARLHSGKTALELDAAIKESRKAVAALAGYADSQQAEIDAGNQSAALQQQHEQRQALAGELAAARAALESCNPTHKTKCINPAKAEIARLEALQVAPVANIAAGDYAGKHSEYRGAVANLVALERQRDAMQAPLSAWPADVRMIAGTFNVTPESANSLKWLGFTLLFDLLSFLFRVSSAYLRNGEPDEIARRRRLHAMLTGGFSLDEAVAMLTGGNAVALPVAKVQLNTPVPAMDVGGKVLTDGLVMLHAGERVLTAAQTAEYEAAQGVTTPLNDPVKRNDPVKTTPLNDPVSDFGTGQCRHCGAEFKRMTWNHAHCSTECRIAAWETKTGAKFRKVKKG